MHEGEYGGGDGWWCGWANCCLPERVLRRLELELLTCFSLPLGVQKKFHPLLRLEWTRGPRDFVVTGHRATTLLLWLGQKKSGMVLGEGGRVDGRNIGGGNGGDGECL